MASPGKKRRRKRRKLRKLAAGLRSQADKAAVWTPPPGVLDPLGEPEVRYRVSSSLNRMAEYYERRAEEL